MNTISKMLDTLFEDFDPNQIPIFEAEISPEKKEKIDKIWKAKKENLDLVDKIKNDDLTGGAKFKTKTADHEKGDSVTNEFVIKKLSGEKKGMNSLQDVTLDAILKAIDKVSSANNDSSEDADSSEDNTSSAVKNIENINPDDIISDEEKTKTEKQIDNAEKDDTATPSMSKIKDGLIKKAVDLLSDIDDVDLKKTLDAQNLTIDAIEKQSPRQLLDTLTQIRALASKYKLIKQIINSKDNVEQDNDEFDKSLKSKDSKYQDLVDLSLNTLLNKTESELTKINTHLQSKIEEFNKQKSEKTGKEQSEVTDAQKNLIQKIKLNYFKYDIRDLVERKYLSDFPYTFNDVKDADYKEILKTITSKASQDTLDTLVPLDQKEIDQFKDAIGKSNEEDGNKKLHEILDNVSKNKHGGNLEKAIQKLHDDIFDIVKGEKDLTQYTKIQVPQEATEDKSALNTWNQSVKYQIQLLDDMRKHKQTNDQVKKDLDDARTNWDLFIVPLKQLKMPETQTDSKVEGAGGKWK